VLTAAATELQLARNRTDEVSNDVGHLVYLLTRMLFSAVATSSLLRTVTTATL
jgi:H2-forming N5,N10-methylenetetrahydromethanopterin dehydrogenase-like enzyme